MNLPEAQLRQIFSELYADACVRGIDMRDFAANFESIREQIVEKPGTECWNLMKLDKEYFIKKENLDFLLRLKRSYCTELVNTIIARVEQVAATDPKQAWKIWLKEYVDALINWRSSVYDPLCNHNFSFDEEKQNELVEFKKLNKRLLHDKWVEALPFLEKLTRETSLDKYQLSCLNSVMGLVILYWMPDIEQCVPYFEKAKELCPENCRPVCNMGEYYWRKHEFEKARTAFLAAISLEPKDTDNYLFLGFSYKNEKKLETAEQWYNDAINVNLLASNGIGYLIQLYGEPDWYNDKRHLIDDLLEQAEAIEQNLPVENSLYNRYRDAGHAHLAASNYETAKLYYEKAYKLRPDLTAAKLDIAYTCGYMKDFPQAKEWINISLDTQDDSMNYDTYWAFGWIYDQWNFAEPSEELTQTAVGYYEKCFGLRKEFKETIYSAISNTFNETGRFFYKAENFEKAKEYFKKAIDQKQDAIYFENLGLTNEKLSLDTEAVEAYEKFIEQDPETGNAFNRMGVFYHNRLQYDKAIGFYKKALARDPNNEIYLENLAYAYESTMQYPSATEIYHELLNINPENDDALYGLARIALNNGNNEEALAQVTKALKIKPDSIEYLKTAGTVYENLNNNDAALEIYNKALSANDEDEYFNNRAGIMYYLKKTPESLQKAIEFYKKAIRINEAAANSGQAVKDLAAYWQNVALAYADLGEYDEAEKTYLHSLDVDANIADHYNSVGNFYFNFRSNWSRSREMYEKAVQLSPDVAVYTRNLAGSYEQLGDYKTADALYGRAEELDGKAQQQAQP